MSGKELDQAVRAYLQGSGPVEAQQIRRGLGNVVELSQIRAALKRIGAKARVFGDWPKYASNGDRIPRTYASGYSVMPNTVARFTLYSIGGAS